MTETIRWNWNLSYNIDTQKWTASFDAHTYPSIFNRESKDFKDYKTAFLWFETKLAEFNRGIDEYIRQLKKQDLMLMKNILEGTE